MATDLDDLLRSRLRELVDRPGYTADELEREVRSRADRHRRRHRSTVVGGGLLAVIALSAGAAIVLTDGSPDFVTSDASSPEASRPNPGPTPDRPVNVEAIDVYAGPTGTERLVVQFDGPVPHDPPTYVPDIEHPDVPGLAYTTQQPDGLKLCDATHWFPGDTGTVDLLIPETWLASATLPDDPPLRRFGDFPPAKVVWCGPYRGYTQIGIWGPASDDPEDIQVDVTGGGTQLVIGLGTD
jgi:hypothetical protein